MKSPFPKCYMTLWDMTMYNDTLNWSDITPICELITELDFITDFDLVTKFWRFPWNIAAGAASQQTTLTPPDTWSCPTLGLACVLMSRPISPELVLSPDFWISNTPRYFSFALSWTCHVYGLFEFRTSLGTSILLVNNPPYEDRGPTANQREEAIKTITQTCKEIKSLSKIYKDIR